MSNKDAAYLLWLCKRLVFKYREDPKTIKIVEEIINRSNYELDFYKRIQVNLYDHINTSINSLEEIKKYYRNSANQANKEYGVSTINSRNKVFENLDLNNIKK